MRELIAAIVRVLVADCQAGQRRCSQAMLSLCDEHRAAKTLLLLDAGWLARLLALRRDRERLWREEHRA